MQAPLARLSQLSKRLRCAHCLLLIAALAAISSSIKLSAQTVIHRSVVADGAARMTDGAHRVRTTLGQSAIGQTRNVQKQHLAGFWYTVQKRIDTTRYAALVVIPHSHALPGETVTIPLVLQQSKSILKAGVRNFRAVIRFNATLLEPIDKSLYRRVQDTGWVTISGSVHDSAQVLASVDFLAKLGTLESTELTIDSLLFLEGIAVTVMTKNGTFSLDGVCRENGVLRLIKVVEPTSLRIIPNPVSNNAVVRAYVAEQGLTEISITDLRGVPISMLYSQQVVPSALNIPIDAHSIPSGSYYLIMRTPNEVFSQKFIIQK